MTLIRYSVGGYALGLRLARGAWALAAANRAENALFHHPVTVALGVMGIVAVDFLPAARWTRADGPPLPDQAQGHLGLSTAVDVLPAAIRGACRRRARRSRARHRARSRTRSAVTGGRRSR